MTRAVHRWRVYPEGRSQFFTVWLCRDRLVFLDALYRIGVLASLPKADRVEALTFCWEPAKSGRDLGALFFQHGRVGPDTVAHELMHATLAWMKDRRLSPTAVLRSSNGFVSKANERAASAIGRMAAQVARGLARVEGTA